MSWRDRIGLAREVFGLPEVCPSCGDDLGRRAPTIGVRHSGRSSREVSETLAETVARSPAPVDCWCGRELYPGR